MPEVINTEDGVTVIVNNSPVEIITACEQGPQGPAGSSGAPGPGVPTGGTTGQGLAKLSGTDYDTGWTDFQPLNSKLTSIAGTTAAGLLFHNNLASTISLKSYFGTPSSAVTGLTWSIATNPTAGTSTAQLAFTGNDAGVTLSNTLVSAGILAPLNSPAFTGSVGITPTGALSSFVFDTVAGGLPRVHSSGSYPVCWEGTVTATGSSGGWYTNGVTGDWQTNNTNFKLAFPDSGNVTADTFLARNTSGGLLVTNTLTTAPQLTLKRTSSQTADYLQLLHQNGTQVITSFDSTGRLNFYSLTSTTARIDTGGPKLSNVANIQFFDNANLTAGTADTVINRYSLGGVELVTSSTSSAAATLRLRATLGQSAKFLSAVDSGGNEKASISLSGDFTGDNFTGTIFNGSFSGNGSALSGLTNGCFNTTGETTGYVLTVNSGGGADWQPASGGGGSPSGSSGDVQLSSGSGYFTSSDFNYSSGVLSIGSTISMVSTTGNATFPGEVDGGTFFGSGAGLTNLPYNQITTGGNPDGYVLTISGGAPTWTTGGGGGGGITSVDTGTPSNISGLLAGNGSSLFTATIGSGLSWDGSTLSATGGGGGSPGGSSGDIQYNDGSGGFGGITGYSVSITNGLQGITTSNGVITGVNYVGPASDGTYTFYAQNSGEVNSITISGGLITGITTL